MRLIKIVLFSQFLALWVNAQQAPVVANENQIKSLFFAGLKDKMNENYAKASTSFQKITALDAKNDAAYFELAYLALRQNNRIEAEINIKKALALKPDQIWYLRFQTELYKQSGNMDDLLLILDKLIKLLPNEENLYFDRANALLIAGKADEAKKAYDLIEKKFGESNALMLARQSLSPQKPNQLSANHPEDVKNILLVSGNLLGQKKFDEALVLLQKAKDIAPENFEVDLAMADIYQALKKQDLAQASLKAAFTNVTMPVASKIKIVNAMLPRFGQLNYAANAEDLAMLAIETHSEDLKLITLYGDVLYQQGKLQLAKAQYQKALKISDQFYPAYEKLLGLQTLTAAYNEAVQTSDEALSFFPNQAIIYYYRAFALHRKGQNAEAAFEIKSAQALGPDNDLLAMIYALQAEVLIDQQKLKDADLAFDKAITLAPENYLILSNYAYYLALREHNLAKAELLATKAAKALPSNPSVLDTYALVLLKLGKYKEALTWQEKSLQNKEALNPVYLEHYGDILFLTGAKEMAVEQWKRAKEVGNTSEKLIRKINERKYIK